MGNKEALWTDYYKSQLENIYEDTKYFLELTRRHRFHEKYPHTLDIGCGGGSRTIQFAQAFPKSKVVGMDYVESMVELGRKLKDEARLDNVDFEFGDWFKLGSKNKGRFDLIFNFHTFCCFKDPVKALECMLELEPKALVIKSLFYDGPMDVLIHQRCFDRDMADDDPDGDFNIFSIQKVRAVLERYGWKRIEFEYFHFPKPLEQPKHRGPGSYTRRLDNMERALFSGPVYLPWHFLIAEKGPA